jgi:hypothetical protein
MMEPKIFGHAAASWTEKNPLALDNHKNRQYEIKPARYTTLRHSVQKRADDVSTLKYALTVRDTVVQH